MEIWRSKFILNPTLGHSIEKKPNCKQKSTTRSLVCLVVCKSSDCIVSDDSEYSQRTWIIVYICAVITGSLFKHVASYTRLFYGTLESNPQKSINQTGKSGCCCNQYAKLVNDCFSRIGGYGWLAVMSLPAERDNHHHHRGRRDPNRCSSVQHRNVRKLYENLHKPGLYSRVARGGWSAWQVAPVNGLPGPGSGIAPSFVCSSRSGRGVGEPNEGGIFNNPTVISWNSWKFHVIWCPALTGLLPPPPPPLSKYLTTTIPSIYTALQVWT